MTYIPLQKSLLDQRSASFYLSSGTAGSSAHGTKAPGTRDTQDTQHGWAPWGVVWSACWVHQLGLWEMRENSCISLVRQKAWQLLCIFRTYFQVGHPAFPESLRWRFLWQALQGNSQPQPKSRPGELADVDRRILQNTGKGSFLSVNLKRGTVGFMWFTHWYVERLAECKHHTTHPPAEDRSLGWRKAAAWHMLLRSESKKQEKFDYFWVVFFNHCRFNVLNSLSTLSMSLMATLAIWSISGGHKWFILVKKNARSGTLVQFIWSIILCSVAIVSSTSISSNHSPDTYLSSSSTKSSRSAICSLSCPQRFKVCSSWMYLLGVLWW